MSKGIDFEKSLKRLEKIVQDLEGGNLALDEALKKYEEGIELAKDCSKTLKEAKIKVEKLVKKEGSLVTEEFAVKEED
ncbi:MAG: exodeoxyribonuclease VII small subunit [Candidatus Omnitrophota bacterium]